MKPLLPLSLFLFSLSSCSLGIEEKIETIEYDTYITYKDISYGEDTNQTLDLAIPKNYSGNGIVIFIHGGAWISGDKSDYTDALATVSSMNYAAATLNYRFISDSISCYDILEDMDHGIQKIKDFSQKKGIALENMILSGHSAGGHLSLLYSYKNIDTSPLKPVAVVPMAAPTDLTLDSYYTLSGVYTLFSNMINKDFTSSTKEDVIEDLLKISPISHITSNTIPTLIAQGLKDTIVSSDNAIELEEKLKENNVTYDIYLYPNSNHDLALDSEINDAFYLKFKEYIDLYLQK